MNLVIFGTGEYRHWASLDYVQRLNERFAQYIVEHWPDAHVRKQEPVDAWKAAEVRTKLGSWLTTCGQDDDLVLLWSGHGIGDGGQHCLVTYESPLPGQGGITTENTIATAELAGFLAHCPARRIIVLLNTCWSGDGGQQLAASIGDRMANSLARKQKRSMAVISSARREEALDGAFLSSALTVLRGAAPPPGLAAEYRWPASERYLSPERLCAAVNVLLADSDHQAQIQTPYGVVGGFFLRANAKLDRPQLPARLVSRLEKEFSVALSAQAGRWDADWVKASIQQHSASAVDGGLVYRLSRLALGLAVLDFIEGWLGPDAGVGHHLEPAWQSVLSPIRRIPYPTERFGFIEQIVLHAADQQIIEFVARVIHDAGDKPCDDRLYEWARRELGVDRKVVDDALEKISSSSVQYRLIINFGITIAADGEQDALPESVIAWLYKPDGSCPASQEYSFDPPYDVAEMVGRLVLWARGEVGDIPHVDVALPISLFRSSTRPEAARVKLRSRFSKPVAEYSGVIIRWASRISDKGLRAEGLAQGNKIAETSALDWIKRDEYGSPQELFDTLKQPARAVAFSFGPDDPDVFYAATYNSPYVLWVDGEVDDATKLQEELANGWQGLPGRLRETYGYGKPDVVQDVRAVWDDPDWLAKIVPNLIDPNHRLSI